jgi:hypothetical protein
LIIIKAVAIIATILHKVSRESMVKNLCSKALNEFIEKGKKLSPDIVKFL